MQDSFIAELKAICGVGFYLLDLYLKGGILFVGNLLLGYVIGRVCGARSRG